MLNNQELHYACIKNNLDIFKLLLKQETNTNNSNLDENKPLYLSAYARYLRVFKYNFVDQDKPQSAQKAYIFTLKNNKLGISPLKNAENYLVIDSIIEKTDTQTDDYPIDDYLVGDSITPLLE